MLEMRSTRLALAWLLMRASGIPAQSTYRDVVEELSAVPDPVDVPGQLPDRGLHPGRDADGGPGERPATPVRDRIALLVPVRRRPGVSRTPIALPRRFGGNEVHTSQGTLTEGNPYSLREEDRGHAQRRDLRSAHQRDRSWWSASGRTTVLDQTFNDVDLVGRPR